MLDLELATPPAVPPVSYDELKRHLRLDWDDDKDLVEAYRDAAVAELDGYAGLLGRCLVDQTWRLYLPEFPCGWGQALWHWRRACSIRLPLPPLIAVVEIAYLDPDGESQVLDPATYVVLTGELAEIQLAEGQSWPATACHPRAVTITFRCGYAAGDPDAEPVVLPSPAAVPASLRAAIKLVVGDLYENREAQAVAGGTLTAVQNPTVERLVRPYRRARL